MTVLGYIVGIIIAAFSSGGLWSWLSARKKPQIDMLTATAAASNSAGEIALAVAKRAEDLLPADSGRGTHPRIRAGAVAAGGRGYARGLTRNTAAPTRTSRPG